MSLLKDIEAFSSLFDEDFIVDKAMLATKTTESFFAK